MAIEKEKFFKIIDVVSAIQGLNEDNLLQKVKEGLYEVEQKLPEEDRGEYNKLKNNFWKNHLFSVKTSNGPVDYTLLHLAVEHTNVLIVELLLKKKVRVDIRVKDGSKDEPTSLHIAALHGYQKLVQLLVDNNANPSLRNAQDQTPREMVGNVENKDDIVKILKKAKDLNIKIEGRGSYHLSQGYHETLTNPAVNGNDVTASKRYDSYSIGSISDDSGLELEQEEIEELKVQLGELHAQLEDKQKENQSLRQKIKNLESENAILKDKLDKTESQHSNYLVEHETKLEALKKQNQKNKSLEQKIQDLENENVILKCGLEKTKTKTNEMPLEKTGKRQFSLKVSYASLAAMLAVGATLSIASGLSVLLIVAASAVSALIAGGITYTISKPIAEPKPDTELKEVAIQGSAQHSVCKT